MSASLSEKMGLPKYNPPDILWRFGPEIRNSIYREVFEGDISNCDSLAFMRASKQLHCEAGSHFYASNPFVLQAPFRPAPGATILPPINNRYLRFLKDPSLEFHTGPAFLARVQKTATTIRNLTIIGANFHTVTFLIQFPPELSSFLQARLDDATMDKSHPITAALVHLLDSGASRKVRIVLNEAWFATGIATELKSRYGERLQFMQVDDKVGMREVTDLLSYERPLMGVSSSGLQNFFDASAPDDISITGTFDFNFLDPVLELGPHGPNNNSMESDEPDEDLSSFDLEEFEEAQDEEELNEDDDVDMDKNLIPLEDEEADTIMNSWNDTANILSNEAQMKTEVEFLVAMAPELL